MHQTKFWNTFDKIGIRYANKNLIPMEIILDDDSISLNVNDVLHKWQNDFSSLFSNTGEDTDCSLGNPSSHATNNASYQQQMSYNQHISIFEVKKAIYAAKRGKASGIDNIPMEVLKNDTAVSFLDVLFNVCFENGIVPAGWGKCIINPIPKSSTTDRRDPLSYRGISLAPAMYKLYCSVLNS